MLDPKRLSLVGFGHGKFGLNSIWPLCVWSRCSWPKKHLVQIIFGLKTIWSGILFGLKTIWSGILFGHIIIGLKTIWSGFLVSQFFVSPIITLANCSLANYMQTNYFRTEWVSDPVLSGPPMSNTVFLRYTRYFTIFRYDATYCDTFTIFSRCYIGQKY